MGWKKKAGITAGCLVGCFFVLMVILFTTVGGGADKSIQTQKAQQPQQIDPKWLHLKSHWQLVCVNWYDDSRSMCGTHEVLSINNELPAHLQTYNVGYKIGYAHGEGIVYRLSPGTVGTPTTAEEYFERGIISSYKANDILFAMGYKKGASEERCKDHGSWSNYDEGYVDGLRQAYKDQKYIAPIVAEFVSYYSDGHRYAEGCPWDRPNWAFVDSTGYEAKTWKSGNTKAKTITDCEYYIETYGPTGVLGDPSGNHLSIPIEYLDWCSEFLEHVE